LSAFSVGEAAARAWRRRRLVGALALAHVVAVALASVPLDVALMPLLDGRPAASTLIRGDLGLAIELLTDHPELIAGALAAASLASLLWAIVSWALDGGVLAALVPVGEARAIGARAVLEASARRAGKMIAVGAAGLVLRLPSLAIAGGGAAWVRARVEHDGGPVATRAIEWAAIALAFVAWALSSTAIDCARGFAFADARVSAWRAIGRGVRTVFARAAASLQLAALGTLVPLALTVGSYALSTRLPNGPLWSLLAVLALRLAVAYARIAFACGALAGAGLLAADRLAARGDHPVGRGAEDDPQRADQRREIGEHR